MFFSTELVLGALLALCAAILVTQMFLRVDSKVDERQVAYSKLAGLLERAHLPKMADIGHHLAALSIRKSAEKIRSLVESLDGEEEMLLALKANFAWQTGKRLAIADDRKALLETLAGNPKARAEFKALIAEHPETAIEAKEAAVAAIK